MRTTRLFNAVSWKYAVGEVFLIVVGVSLALMANSWYESWQDAKDESQTLVQIAAALESDVEFLRSRFAQLRNSEQRLTVLLEKLESELTVGSEAETDFQSVIAWRGIRMRSGPYDELKNRGLSPISNDALRLSLVDLYESRFSALEGVTANDEIFSRDQVLPYFYSHFRRVGTQEWAPINGYEALDEDIYFENLVAAKLDRLQVFLLPAYEDFCQIAEMVLMQIREELASYSG
jgi:hypothetical protein